MNTPQSPRPGLRDLLATPSFLRLWAIGGCVTAMRWFEVLAAALFTLDATNSGLAVAVVTAARSLPMFLLGAFAGVLTEAVNRKHVMVVGYLLAACASAGIALLGWLGGAQPWHLGIAALIAGTVWSTEMATRRRMVGEAVEAKLVPRALALDTMSNSLTRLAGPVVAGVLYEWGGLAVTFTVSTAVFLLAAFLGSGLRYRQETRRQPARGDVATHPPARRRKARDTRRLHQSNRSQVRQQGLHQRSHRAGGAATHSAGQNRTGEREALL